MTRSEIALSRGNFPGLEQGRVPKTRGLRGFGIVPTTGHLARRRGAAGEDDNGHLARRREAGAYQPGGDFFTPGKVHHGILTID